MTAFCWYTGNRILEFIVYGGDIETRWVELNQQTQEGPVKNLCGAMSRFVNFDDLQIFIDGQSIMYIDLQVGGL